MKRYALMAAVAAALGTASLLQAEQPGGQTGQQPGQQQMQPGQTGQAGQQAGMQDSIKRYVNDTYSQNRTETKLAQRIAEQTQNPQIKQFAQSVIQDRQQANDKLKQAAQQASIQVSEEENPVCKAMLEYTAKIPNDQFERGWVFHQVGAQQTRLLENLYVAQHAQNPQIKQYAQEHARAMQQQLEQAQQLAQAQVRGETPRMMGQPAGQTGQPGQPGQTGQPGQDPYKSQPQSGQPDKEGRTGEGGGMQDR